MKDARKQAISRRFDQADKLSGQARRTLSAVDTTQAGLEANKARSTPPILPGLPGNPFGPMDWREFYWFCREILHYTDMMPQPHDEMCQFAASLFPDLSFKGDTQQFGMMLVPRNTFKSVIFSVGLPLFILWKNPNARILLSGHRHDASKDQLRTVKWNIEQNEDFIDLCGNWKPQFREQKYAEDAIIIIGRTEALRDPSIDTCGVDRSKVGAHPDVIILDDVHSESNIITAIMRNKVLEHILNMYPMLQPGGTAIILATRWHYADAYGKLLKLDDDAELAGRKRTWKTMIRSCYLEDEKGKKVGLFFPTRLSETFLDTMRYKLGPAKFALFYLNKPIDDDSRLFPKAQLEQAVFKYIYDHDMGLPCLMWNGEAVPVGVTMAWDTAGIKPSDKSDFHGVTVVGCDPDDRWLVPYAEAIKGKPDAVIKRVVAVILSYQPELLIIESVGQSGTWAYLLRAYMESEGLHCPPIIFYTPSTAASKDERITLLQPRWVNHEIVIDRRCRELIDQFDSFPQLDYDDLLDSLQMHLDYAVPCDPSTLDELFMNKYAMLPKAGVTVEDPRKKLGSYAGMGSTVWASQRVSDVLD